MHMALIYIDLLIATIWVGGHIIAVTLLLASAFAWIGLSFRYRGV